MIGWRLLSLRFTFSTMQLYPSGHVFDEFGSFELPEPDEASDSFSKIGAAVTDDEFNELFGPTE